MNRIATILIAMLLGPCGAFAGPKSTPEGFTLVVMDPLSKELACACVKGFGQRDYRKLAARLESTLKQRVNVEFSDDLAQTLSLVKPGPDVIVIGEPSLVKHGAKQADFKCHSISELSDLDGNTTLTGIFIARSDDSAKELKDVSGRKLYFGLGETDEKQAAAMAALRASGITPPDKPDKQGAHTDAALDLLDSSLSPLPIAVIPNYTLRLLEGCGSVKPGTLKVIGKTQPVPFITVFVADAIPADKQEKILKSLLDVKSSSKLLKAMESKEGFKPISSQSPGGAKTGARSDWPDWRGPGRDGHVPRLPERLPATAKYVWKKAAMTGGLAGLSASDGKLILAERDFADERDVYRCLNANNGELVWLAQFSAPGQLDYGQSPRATPVIHKGRAYLLGAFGDLRCVNMSNGKVVWQRNLPREFKAELPTWGMCCTPLIVDDMVIVNPGGTNASLVALDCVTGRTRWATPGLPAAYSAFICGEFGGRRQIVGYDQHSLGGWDVKTGKRLWQLVPPTEGDFNVPTPMAVNGNLLVATENNGTRLYQFDSSGIIIPKPAAASAELSPDSSSPVVTCGRIFGSYAGLRCLDTQNGLKEVWRREDNSLGDYSTLIADDERVLVITLHGELILLDGKANECAIISRLRMFEDEVEVYSHPALVGTRLYARGGSSVVCMDLAMD
jgi:outer membrane protein assembly factor BamB